jgi:hypothetical protein
MSVWQLVKRGLINGLNCVKMRESKVTLFSFDVMLIDGGRRVRVEL